MILCSRSVTNAEKAVESEVKQMGEGNYAVHDTSNVCIVGVKLTVPFLTKTVLFYW